METQLIQMEMELVIFKPEINSTQTQLSNVKHAMEPIKMPAVNVQLIFMTLGDRTVLVLYIF